MPLSSATAADRARVFLAWLFMSPLALGLDGYAFGFAASCLGQLLSLLLVVFVWRRQHLEPQRFWCAPLTGHPAPGGRD